jgi:hypothetical protein
LTSASLALHHLFSQGHIQVAILADRLLGDEIDYSRSHMSRFDEAKTGCHDDGV